LRLAEKILKEVAVFRALRSKIISLSREETIISIHDKA